MVVYILERYMEKFLHRWNNNDVYNKRESRIYCYRPVRNIYVQTRREVGDWYIGTYACELNNYIRETLRVSKYRLVDVYE